MGATSWNGKEVREALVKRLVVCVGRAGRAVEKRAKVSVSRGNKTGKNPSKPGEPPKTVTGMLRAAIGSEVKLYPTSVVGLIGIRKGSPAEAYARALELGFHGMVTLPPRVVTTGVGFGARNALVSRPEQYSGVGFGLQLTAAAGMRMMNLDARPYLRPALLDSGAEIGRAFGVFLEAEPDAPLGTGFE